METLLIYSLKVSVALTLFSLVDILFLKNDTFFKLRRSYFLFALTFSLFFSFIQFKISDTETNILITGPYMLSEIEIYVNHQFAGEGESQLSLLKLFVYLSVVGSVILSVRLLTQLGSLYYSHFRNKNWVEMGRYKLSYIERDGLSSFSFFHWIVINTSKQSQTELRDVLEHEKSHARQFHSIDVMLYELLSVALWWNPFVWLLRKEMRLNLEYLADQGAVKGSDDHKAYQYTLLQINMASTGMAIINNFNVSHLKKRIIMMNKKRTSIFKSAKFLIVLPLTLMLIGGNMAYSQDKQEEVQQTEIGEKETVDNEKKSPVVYEMVESMPRYQGGVEEMLKYIQETLEYPKSAEDAGVQGRVIIRFTVRETGDIDNVKVLRGIDPACDQEAIRVVRSMPKWTPGKQNGENVAVYFNLPIMFKMPKKDK